MAEALLRHALLENDEIWIESAGLGALVGYPADPFSIELMHERGIDISAHRARQIHPDMVNAADLVLVMESGHRRVIDEADPAARDKVHRLGEWQNIEIADPYRKSKEAFVAALDEIESGVASWVEKIN